MEKGVVETRLATMTDAPDLAALHAESFGDAAWGEQQIADSLKVPANQCWVVGGVDALHGFILCQLVGEEAEILTFCVSPGLRRGRVGTGLLAVSLNTARTQGVRKFFLEVAVDNDAALGFYEKAGFARTGRRSNYYKRRDGFVDALMLGLDL